MRPASPFLKGVLAGPAPPAHAEGAGGLIERGRLHEAIPARPGAEAAALGFLAGLARQKAAKPVLWVREQSAAAETGALYAPGLKAYGLHPADLILVCARKREDALWAAEQSLRAEGLTVLLELSGRDKPIDLTATRRLALACEKSHATALVLRGDIVKAPATPSAAWSRWAVSPAASMSAAFDEVGLPTLEARLLRHRAGPAGACFILEWTADEHAFRAQKVGGDLAASPLHRPDHARRTG